MGALVPEIDTVALYPHDTTYRSVEYQIFNAFYLNLYYMDEW